MYKNKKIGVVIPCYKEETQIGMVIETMPEYVDKMVVVDDHSPDRTVEIVKEYQKKEKYQYKIILICHEKNLGLGKAVSDGYIWCRDNEMDVAVRMDGDGQMDPVDMPELLDPVVEDKADYSKGNRLITGEAWQKIPKIRYLGNSALTMMTKIASGYWHVTDSQTGYTAINKRALKMLPIESIYTSYGMPNDLLVTLNIYNMRVMDVPVNPLYGFGEKSKMRISNKIVPLFFLLIRLFGKRMLSKYIIRDFHPLIFFYSMSFLLFVIAAPIWGKVFYSLILYETVLRVGFPTSLLVTIMASQFLFFAMWLDMDYNRNLNPHR